MAGQQPVVFVIDDDDAVRDSLCVLLETHGFAVREYTSGTAFLHELPAERSGCLLIDVHMPNMSGLELLERLRERSFPMPVILITGQETADIRSAAAHAGVRLLAKAVLPSELIGGVQEAIDRSKT